MFSRQIKLLSVFLLLLLFNLVAAVPLLAADNGFQVSNLYTEILPEYDAPDILVINTIDFKNTTGQDYSGGFKWIIPKGTRTQIVSDETNKKDYLNFNIIQNKDYDEIDWNATAPIKAGATQTYHLEFYYNNFQGTTDKKFSYDIVPSYPLNAILVAVNQPTKATNFKTDPDFGQSTINQGLIMYGKNFSALTPGQKQTINVSYTKTDASLTAPPSQNQNQNQTQSQAQTSGQAASSGTTSHAILIIILIAVIVIIAVVVVLKLIGNKKMLARYEELATDYDDEDEDEDDEEEDEDDDEDNEVDEKDEDNEEDVKQPASEEVKEQKKLIDEQYKSGLLTEEQYYEKLMELED